jgi:hypothetical protein
VIYDKMPDMGPVFVKADKRARVAIVKGLRSAARHAGPFLARRTPKDRGGAAAGWRGSYRTGVGNVVAYCLNSCPYIGILEKGSRPHAVSKEGQEAIYQWVLRNLRVVGTRQEGFAAVHGNDLNPGQRRRTFKSIGEQGETLAHQITFLICRKIRKFGQKPRYFVRDSMEELTAAARGEVERCLTEIKSEVRT